MIIYMAIVLYAPALALSQVTGISVWAAVLSIGLVCTFYTSVGGMKAVVWTDFFQVTMMFISMFVVVFKGANDEGGWAKVWQTNVEGQRIEFFNFDPNPTTRHTVWNLAIGGYFTWIAVYGVNQAMVQRYLSIPTLHGAQTALWLNFPGLVILLTISCLAGLVIYSKYHSCDPLSWTKFKLSPDQLFPLFVMDVLGFLPGLPGLFVSGIFSGALSTVSSGVSSLAAVTLEDVVKAYLKKDISELWATRMTKILAVVYGLIAIALVAVAQLLGNVLQAALTIFGVIGGPLLGLFSLGMFFPCANNLGAIFGLLSGLVMSLWVGFGNFTHKPSAPKPPFSISSCHNGTAVLASTVAPAIKNKEIFQFYRLSYMWFSPFACVVVVIVGLLTSFITGLSNSEDVDPKLIIPLVDKLFCYLPPRVKRKLRFHVGPSATIYPKDKPTSSLPTVMTVASAHDDVKPPFNKDRISNLHHCSTAPALREMTPEKDKVDSGQRESNKDRPLKNPASSMPSMASRASTPDFNIPASQQVGISNINYCWSSSDLRELTTEKGSLDNSHPISNRDRPLKKPTSSMPTMTSKASASDLNSQSSQKVGISNVNYCTSSSDLRELTTEKDSLGNSHPELIVTPL
ncbi:sodium-coupled monocarboxylate transporter 1-like isoform X2 [Tachypleus tridentatus]